MFSAITAALFKTTASVAELSNEAIPDTIVTDTVKRYADYTLAELSELSFVERFLLNDWKLEMFTIGFIIIFVALFKLGDIYNTNLVNKFLKGLSPVFTNNFALYGVNATDLYIKDSAENFSSYATGRDNVAKVDITIKLKPRHNTFVWILEFVLSYFTESVVSPSDKVEIAIIPSRDVTYDNFIFAVVAKLGMNDARRFHYFLSLTKTTDSDSLPPAFVHMGEVNEIQDKLTTEELKTALTAESADLIKFIAFTDQPAEKPESIPDLIPRRRVVISTGISTNAAQLKHLNDVIQAVFDILDDLVSAKITLKPETLRKVIKTRETELGKIHKALDEVKKEKLAEEKAEKKRAEMKQIRKLSSEEQQKLEKKAQDKKQRKLAKKQKTRV